MLEETPPDVLLLDWMLPGVSGLEICQRVRATPQWKDLRVLFLTASRDVESRVAAFQAGEVPVFLLSLKAGGTGLNLTRADHVIHLDPWWNPAVEDQATDRAHRLGQTRPVTVSRLVSEGTVEEAIIALHAQKRELAASLLSEANAAAALSPEQLLALLRFSSEPPEVASSPTGGVPG